MRGTKRPLPDFNIVILGPRHHEAHWDSDSHRGVDVSKMIEMIWPNRFSSCSTLVDGYNFTCVINLLDK